jgi:polyribonucleotide nucleotidyltransferase
VSFPTHEELERATFDMVVAGRVLPDGEVAIMMVEAEATEHTVALVAGGATAPTEEIVAGGLEAAKPTIRELCRAQEEMAAVAAKPTVEFPVFLDYQDDAYTAVQQAVGDQVAEALRIAGKAEREESLDRIKGAAHEQLDGQFEGREKEISAAFRSVTKKEVRSRVLRDQIRIDGRGLRDIRPLTAEVDVLPRVHGSALFERGETQILGVTTLNMLRLEQSLDTLSPQKTKRYMHNYNFPPYSTGETGRVGAPKRREIGHGALAERALIPVLPSREEFPYAIRQVSEALSSNGSTSMGSVCASTMSLLSAGVPLKASVAGIAMGLISDEVDGKTAYVTLTDILGAEDAYGDMDFKVAGTSEFVTALQLDTKLDGIPSDVLAGALQQAHEARHTILGVMADAIASPAGMSQYAPRVTTIKIPVDKIGAVIGPKGQMINAIQDETGADITIEDDGTIYVGATDGPSADAAVERINAIANPTLPKIGDKFLGTVVKTAAFGAFISLLPGRDGLLHISKVGNGKRVERVEDFLNVGDKVEVQIADIDQRGKIYLDKVRPEGEEEPATEAGGERPAGRDRGDRGPRDRGSDRGDRDRGPGRGLDRGPSADGPAADGPGDDTGEAGGDDEARRRRRRQR